MNRMVSQVLWSNFMGELGCNGNNYENDTFAVRSYDWSDDDNNNWHFWHKPSGLKIEWYKYPLRSFEANMDITDAEFLNVILDCTNSMQEDKNSSISFFHETDKWWEKEKEEEISDVSKYIYDRLSFVYCDNCRYYREIDENDPNYGCEDCHRKYSGWGISIAEAEKIAKAIETIRERKDNDQTTGNMDTD